MIKVEYKDGATDIELFGEKNIILEELAHAIREVHRVIEAKEGKEMADQMIDVAHRLALMSDEEIEKEHEKIKRKNEEQMRLLGKEVSEFFNNLFAPGGNK